MKTGVVVSIVIGTLTAFCVGALTLGILEEVGKV